MHINEQSTQANMTQTYKLHNVLIRQVGRREWRKGSEGKENLKNNRTGSRETSRKNITAAE